MSSRTALTLAAILTTLSACSAAPAPEGGESQEQELRATDMEGSWVLPEDAVASTKDARFLGLKLTTNPDDGKPATYTAELRVPCTAANQNPTERVSPAGCAPKRISGTWSSGWSWWAPSCPDKTKPGCYPWGFYTKIVLRDAFGQGKSLSLIAMVGPPTWGSSLQLVQVGDALPDWVSSDPAVRVSSMLVAGTSDFCATSEDCPDTAPPTIACRAGTDWKRLCVGDGSVTSPRRCSVPSCLDGSVAGYGDACGLLPGQTKRVTCRVDPTGKASLTCLDNMAGGYGVCQVAP